MSELRLLFGEWSVIEGFSTIFFFFPFFNLAFLSIVFLFCALVVYDDERIREWMLFGLYRILLWSLSY